MGVPASCMYHAPYWYILNKYLGSHTNDPLMWACLYFMKMLARSNDQQKKCPGMATSKSMSNQQSSYMSYTMQGRKKPRSDCPGQVNFALGQAKMEVWWPGGQVKLASAVLLVTAR